MIFAGAINIALASEAVAPWTCQIWHDRKQLAQVLVVWWWVWVCTLWCKSIIFDFILKKNLQICNSTPARWQTQPQSAPMRPMPEGRWSCLLEPQSCLLAAPTPPERHRYDRRAVIWVWFPNSTHTSTRNFEERQFLKKVKIPPAISGHWDRWERHQPKHFFFSEVIKINVFGKDLRRYKGVSSAV